MRRSALGSRLRGLRAARGLRCRPPPPACGGPLLAAAGAPPARLRGRRWSGIDRAVGLAKLLSTCAREVQQALQLCGMLLPSVLFLLYSVSVPKRPILHAEQQVLAKLGGGGLQGLSGPAALDY